jgi:hypothetical protein
MIRKRLPLAVVAVGALWLAACASSSVQWSPTQPSPRPMEKRAVSSVEVFQDQAPPRPHIEVGVLSAEKARSAKSDVRAKLTGDMQKKAATLGCDAIHVRDVSQPEIPGSKKQPPMSLQAGCLMWTADQAPVATAPVPPPAPEAAPPAGPGCTNDMDCKGDRICENGQCVSPPSPTGAPPADAGASQVKCDRDTDCPGEDICQNKVCRPPR